LRTPREVKECVQNQAGAWVEALVDRLSVRLLLLSLPSPSSPSTSSETSKVHSLVRITITVTMGSDTEARLSEQDKLRGAENYHQWADEIDNILRSKGLKSFIDPTKTCPKKLEALGTETLLEVTRRTTREAEIETWEANDAKTLVAIQQNITKQPKDLVRGIKSASAMWAKLKKHYEGKGQSLKSQYLSEIQELDYSSNKFEDITSFIVAFQNLYT
jgi:hypothetical protein